MHSNSFVFSLKILHMANVIRMRMVLILIKYIIFLILCEYIQMLQLVQTDRRMDRQKEVKVSFNFESVLKFWNE